jgi:hypothetical protein
MGLYLVAVVLQYGTKFKPNYLLSRGPQ